MTSYEDIRRTNLTARASYSYEGPGIGAGDEALDRLRDYASIEVPDRAVCLEIGFGKGALIQRLIVERDATCIAIDIASASFNDLHKWAIQQRDENAKLADVRYQIPFACDWPYHTNETLLYLVVDDVSHLHVSEFAVESVVDFAFCTETIEHLSNPYHAIALTKRLLKHNGVFVIAFPMPEDNLGYGGGEHAHIYPGFLRRDSFERFMKQLYFKQVARVENGSSAWYVFRNYKGDGVVDAFSIVSGNYTEEELFSCLDSFGE